MFIRYTVGGSPGYVNSNNVTFIDRAATGGAVMTCLSSEAVGNFGEPGLFHIYTDEPFEEIERQLNHV